jgi:hypothetical protein
MELLDIATWHASGEEAVGAIFVQGNRNTVPSDSWGAAQSHRERR